MAEGLQGGRDREHPYLKTRTELKGDPMPVDTPGTIYLAGPMRGLPDYNFPAFFEAAGELRDLGYSVISPAEREDLSTLMEQGAKDLKQYMEKDLADVCRVDAVVVLPGWQQSTGARLEVYVADRVDVPVLRWPDLSPARHPLSKRIHEILFEWGKLHDLKSMDYGRDDDPFANVRSSTEYGVAAWIGALIRAGDKDIRLKTYALKRKLQNESVEDSFDDRGVYTAIAKVLWEEEQGRFEPAAFGP